MARVGGKGKGRAAKGGVSGRSRATRAPGVGSRAAKAGAAQKRAFKQVMQLYSSSGGWAHRANLVADEIIRIAAQEGVPLEQLKNEFLRRVNDVPVLAAIEKRLAYLARGGQSKKAQKRAK